MIHISMNYYCREGETYNPTFDILNEGLFEPAEIKDQGEKEYFYSIKHYPLDYFPNTESFHKILNIADSENVFRLQSFCNLIKYRPFSEWFPTFFSMIERRQCIISAGVRKILDLCDRIYNMDEKFYRVILAAPPRVGKTTIILYFMLYSIIRNPKDTRHIFISYTDERTSKVSKDFKRLIDNNIYRIGYKRSVFMNEDLSSRITYECEKQYGLNKKNNKDTVSNSKILFASGAEIQFFSASGSITGNGAGKVYPKIDRNGNEITGKFYPTIDRNGNEILVEKEYTGSLWYDDPNKPDGSESDVISEKTNDNFDSVIPSRLNDGSQTSLVIMQQRVKPNDLTGHILKKMEGNYVKYKCIQIPTINKDNYCLFNFTKKDIYDKYLEIGRKNFLAQYQQAPVFTESNLININLFKYYKEDFYDLPCEKWFITTDYSFDGDDKTCLMFWGLHYNCERGRVDLYLVDMFYGTSEEIGIIELTRNFFNKWNRKRTRKFANISINCIIIEKNRNEPILAEIKKYDLPIREEMRSRESTKLIRAQSFAQYFGRTVAIFLPENPLYFPKDYIKYILMYCKNFKGGKKDKDDIVDNILDAGKFATNEYIHVRID